MRFRPALALAVLAASPAYAAPYAFTALPSGFTATALNNLGQVAGQAPADPSVPGPPGATVPALFSGGAITPLGPSLTYADGVYGINDAGGFIGSEQFGRHTLAFAVINGARAGYATPYAALDSLAFTGLNNRGQVAGYSGSPSYNSGGAGDVQSFVSSGGSYVVVDVPGTFQTRASGINDAGQVVGSYITVSGSSPSFAYGKSQGFLYDAGAITTIDRPGAVSTVLVGINDAGEVAGTYTDAAGAQHGFTEAGGVFGDVTGPDGSAFLPRGLNDAGQLIGTFGGAGPSYLATPQAASVPEPASAALLGGFAVLGALGRRRGGRGGSEEARVCDARLARSVLRRPFVRGRRQCRARRPVPAGRRGMRSVALLAGALLAAGPVLAAPYTFTPLPPFYFVARTINDQGQVGGEAQTVVSPGAQGNPAIASGGVITFVPAPFSNFSIITGLNNAGDYVGTLSFGTNSPFAMLGGVAVTLATPPTPGGSVQPNGINNGRQVVGTASTYAPAPNGKPGTLASQGFVSSNGAYVTLNVPGAAATDARGINDAGQVVGSYLLTPGVAGPQQGFIYSDGAYTTLDRPGAVSTPS